MIEPVHFQGLNCYHDCVVSVANKFGIDYSEAFATLWSETDFRYDPYREEYLTKRMISHLEALGAKLENLPVFSRDDKAESLSLLNEGDYIIVGMDAFYIPWNSFYQTFHGSHYFIAEYTRQKTLACADPTYGIPDESICRDTVVEHVFDLIRVSKCASNPPQADPANEAGEILRSHENTREALLARIRGCVGAEQNHIVLMAKYVNAMMNNRYLYRHFLERKTPSYSAFFQNDSLFLKWKAVKNGLYKAAVVKDNTAVADTVCGCMGDLIDEETAIAKKIIGTQ